MSEAPHSTAADEVALGALLELLHDAASSFRTVQATYRTWRHEQRRQEAFRANTEELKRRGAAISTATAVRIGDSQPPETDETVRIWRDGQRLRQEHHGGWRDGHYGIIDGPLWWSWSDQMGAMSNQDDPSVSGGIDQGLEVMLNPTPLMSLLRFRMAGTSQVAGRTAITTHATPRQGGLSDVRSARDPRTRHDLHALGTGADSYQLEVDRERGTLLAVTAIRDKQPFYKVTTLAIRFDEPIPPETFQFRPPEGEPIQSPRGLLPRPQVVSLTQAQRRASFTVLMPDRVPAGWRAHCTFVEASPRPPLPERVFLNYRSEDGHQSISISQIAAADASQHYANIINDQSWQVTPRDGRPVRIAPPGWPQAQAQLQHDETFVFLTSDSLTPDELATIAAGLRPAPSTGLT